MGVAAIVLRLVPRPIVAAAALILAVAVLVLQFGLAVSAARPGYGTLAVGAVAVGGGDSGVAGTGRAAAMAGGLRATRSRCVSPGRPLVMRLSGSDRGDTGIE
jgi:hypothetical protein